MMINAVALCLVVTSLASAGVWSPAPEQKQQNDDVIVKEGHRVVVVEYDKSAGGDGNTKVLISPQDPEGGVKGYLSSAGEKISSAAKEAASVLPNLGQGISENSHPEEEPPHGSRARDVVCDAYGKCKDRIAAALGKTRDKVSEVQETVAEKARGAEEKAKEAISRKTEEVVETAKETAEKAKETAAEAIDTSRTIGQDVTRNVSMSAETMRERMGEKAKGIVENSDGERKSLGEILRRGRDLFGLWAVGSVLGTVQMFGFGSAYGMGMWVTFVSSYVLAEGLPRQQFGVVQSRIYPVYFRGMAYSIGAVLVAHLLSRWKELGTSVGDSLQAYNLVASLLLVLVNLCYLEPRATKVMFESLKLDKEEGRGGRDGFISDPGSKIADLVGDPKAKRPSGAGGAAEGAERAEQDEDVQTRVLGLRERLTKLNRSSSLLNLLTLMGLSWHLVYLGQRLNPTTTTTTTTTAP